MNTTTTVNTSPLSLLRRTPRRKLFSSSEDDDSPLLMSLRTSKSISLLNGNNNSAAIIPLTGILEARTTLSSIENNHVISTRQSKLEQFGFDMLPRSSAVLKRQLCKENLKPVTDSIVPIHRTNKIKRMRTIEAQQQSIMPSSSHTMKTRFQSSTDSHSDHLVKLFDKTLSTVTPVRDSTNEHNVINSRYRRGQPLPLILSDSSHEDDMPVLTLSDSDLSSSENKKRTFEQLQTDENSCGRILKRSKIAHDEENKENAFFIQPPVSIRIRRGIVRSFSEQQPSVNEEQLKASVELGSNRNLIGDRSRTYLLPRCMSRKHADLACISAETTIDLLRGKYSSEIEQLHVIDCRYPYEYDGGHISSAKNIFTRPQIHEEYFRSPIKLKDPTKRIVFVFHCEFSSERAPSLLRYMRSEDRNIHASNYPALHYPELYLLEGGYKALFEHSTEFCKPSFYRTMLDEKFQEQCRQFRSFSKQSEKFTCLREDISHVGYGIQSNSRRTRTTIRSSLSLCFTSTSLANQMDLS
ncbi:unnamed protein product [Rotaria socialis]|uniref:M-phase inducer phosphatase n=1 Tax=Rotaria socialis TaxID=392032 RepID=A0A817UN00_9BILA|nr:unnamed protein product [Rotaria socialis]CAF3333643.1 unnamed protein product [Rotaria socialis]CAF3395088.1 unnamed protein product [Rotaria socialis]CAF3704802.1 unnamed protein product [Rotaria socialis]